MLRMLRHVLLKSCAQGALRLSNAAAHVASFCSVWVCNIALSCALLSPKRASLLKPKFNPRFKPDSGLRKACKNDKSSVTSAKARKTASASSTSGAAKSPPCLSEQNGMPWARKAASSGKKSLRFWVKIITLPQRAASVSFFNKFLSCQARIDSAIYCASLAVASRIKTGNRQTSPGCATKVFCGAKGCALFANTALTAALTATLLRRVHCVDKDTALRCVRYCSA